MRDEARLLPSSRGFGQCSLAVGEIYPPGPSQQKHAASAQYLEKELAIAGASAALPTVKQSLRAISPIAKGCIENR